MATFFDLEQPMALLELEAPFDVRDVQLARRRMAKRWHPDVAPPGKQHEHQRHLQAINDMADELERLAEGSRGGKISRNAARGCAAARAPARARRGPARLRGRAARPRGAPPSAPSTTRSAAACPTTRSCTATRAA